MTEPNDVQDIVEQLQALHVWPQSTADTYADTLGPRRIRALYEVGNVAHEAADEIERLRAALQQSRSAVEALKAMPEPYEYLNSAQLKNIRPFIDALNNWKHLHRAALENKHD